jgi:hypothetical protein
MSAVTGILLLTSLTDADREPLDNIQSWLAEHEGGQQLSEVADHTGGHKHPQYAAFGAGLNYFLQVDEFAEFVLKQDWRRPERVVLILQPEDGAASVLRPAAP